MRSKISNYTEITDKELDGYLNLDEFIKSALKRLKGFIDFKEGWILIQNDSEGSLRFMTLPYSDLIPDYDRNTKSQIELEEREKVEFLFDIIKNFFSRKRMFDQLAEYEMYEKPGIGEIHSIPLVYGGEIIGVFQFILKPGKTLSIKERIKITDFLQNIAESVFGFMGKENKSKQSLKGILDCIADGIALMDFEGKIIEVNSSLENILGTSQSSLYDRKFSEFYAGQPEKIDSTWTEVKLRGIDGRIIKCLERDRIIHFNGFYGYLKTIRDVSEERKREEAIGRIKKLLKIGGKISKLVVVERDRRELLKKTCEILRELDDNIKVSIGVIKGDKIELSTNVNGNSEKLILLSGSEFPCIQFLEKNFRFFKIKKQVCASCKRFEKSMCENNLVLPITHEQRTFGYLWLHLTEDIFSNEELEFIKDLICDLGLALMSIEVEERRKEALNKIKENLEYFEFLSDRLRNPVSIIKGIIDIKKDIGLKRTVDITSQQIDRIIEILDDLRVKEEETFSLREKLTKV